MRQFSPISAPEMVSLWSRADPLHAAGGWNHSRGPLRRVVLTLERLDWKVLDAVTWRDDQGMEIKLVDHSPCMMEGLMARALGRQHELRATHKLVGDSRPGYRVCADVLWSEFLNKKSYDHRQKYLLKTFCTQGLWARDRLRACGYDTDGKCEFCQAPDGVFHRLWECSHAPLCKIRDRLVPGHIQRLAKLDRSDPVWTCGCVLQPADDALIPPAADGGVVFLMMKAMRFKKTVGRLSLLIELRPRTAVASPTRSRV